MDEADKELASLGFPQHVLEGFAQGALLDLRVRLAMQILTHSAAAFAGMPDDAAKHALRVADVLFAEAEARGWVQPIDADAPLSPDLIAQAKRLGAFQFYQQMGANEAATKGASRVAIPRPPMNG